MVGLKVRAFKAAFFDRKAVRDALGRASARVLGSFGRLVRKRAQKSLVYSEQASPPGRAPHAKKTGTVTRRSKSTGKVRVRRVSYLREFLWYAYDRRRQSVVIGPARLNATASGGGAPEVLEYGGTATINDWGQRRRVHIRPRPFMRPALAAERPKLAPMWRNSVR